MSQIALSPNPFFSARRFLQVMFKKLHPSHQRNKARAQLRAHLERLALASPHYLEDIGFERDVDASSPDRVVWRQGPLRVAIEASSRRVCVSA